MQIEILHKAGMLKRPSKHTRLRQARSNLYATAKQAAAAIGIPYGTYSGHESGSRGFNDIEAARYARFFRVKVAWLVYGEEAQSQPKFINTLKKIIHGGLIADAIADPKWGREEPYALTHFLIDEAQSGYKISGHEMSPWFRPGTLIVCSARNYWEIEHRESQGVISIEGLEPRFAIFRPGETDGLWDVEQFAAPALRNVKLEWIEEAIAFLPAQSWSDFSLHDESASHHFVKDGVAYVQMHGIGEGTGERQPD